MSKKGKKAFTLVEDFKEMIAMVPKLEKLLKAYTDIAGGYHKYRNNGGAAIPGIEKHLGIKENSAPVKPKENTKMKEDEAPRKETVGKKAKKKDKK